MLTKEKYNPDENYYMVSFFDSENVAWIRNPFLTAEEVGQWLDVFSIKKGRYKDINIIREDCLDISGFFETIGGDHKEFTIREVLYDDRYEKHAKSLRGHDNKHLTA